MSGFDTADFDVYLSEFAIPVECPAWGTTIQGIFDEQPSLFEDNPTQQPSITVAASDIPTTAKENDAFEFVHPSTKKEVTYRLAWVESIDVGMSRIVLKL